MNEKNQKKEKAAPLKDVAGLYRNAKQLIDFMKVMQVSRRALGLSVILSFLAVMFNVLTIRFFMLFLRGMISQDFEFARSMLGFRSVTSLFPEIFEGSNALCALLIATIFFFTLIKCVLQYASAISVGYQVRAATRSLRELVFSRYLCFGKLYFDRINLGRLSTVLIKFTQMISTQLNSLQRLASQLFSLAAYFGIMFYISWQLTLLTMVIFPIFVFLTQLAGTHFRTHFKEHADSEVRLDERTFSVLMAIPLVKAHGTEEYEKKVFREVSEAEVEASFEMEKKEKLVPPIEEIGMMAACLLLAFAVTMLGPSGKGEIAKYLVFFYVVRLSMPGFSAINQLRLALNNASVRLGWVQEILNDEKKFIIEGGNQLFKGLRKAITYKDLCFGYHPNKPVLSHVSVTFEKGRMTAIVGPTGSGKTTLAHLLLRFYDCAPGSLFLDGKDIREFDLRSLTMHFAYVSQDAFFFNDTLKQNMIYGLANEVHDEQLVDVAKKAKIYDFIMQLPDQFDTKIGERGVQLSGGEKQRLSIARALLRNAEILILDEATSSLDAKTEKLIQEAIGEAVKGRTTIVIAHRFSTIRHAEKIVVLDQGQLAEEGALEDLLAKKGKFYEYWNEQRFF